MHKLDHGTGVLVALHGHGDEPSSARTWGRRMAPASWEVVAPGAPADQDGHRGWFSTGPRGADAGSLTRSAQRIADLLDQIRSTGRPVVVAGFSQGGALALALGASGVQPDAIICICGFFPEVDDDAWTRVLQGTPRSGPAHPPTLVLSGSRDEVVPSFMGEDAARLLAGQGREVTSEVLDGGHDVSPTMADRVRGWLADVLAPGMRVSVGLPVDRVDTGTELVSGEAISELSVLYERLGYHAAFVTDHPAPDDRWLAAGGHQAMEPTVALAVAAAATRRLLVHTNLYVLPYRNPFLAAKALASLDVVSGGRLILGVAAGYLKAEFSAVGAGFDDRTARLEESIELLPRIWADSSVAAEGSGYGARGVTSLPRPTQRPHPPIWVGGNSDAAVRRAVRFGQGWSPIPTPGGMERAVRTAAIRSHEELRARLKAACELCEREGRSDPLTICFVPFSMTNYLSEPDNGLTALAEEVEALEDLGVHWVALTVPGTTRGEVGDRAAGLAQALGLG